MKNYLIRFTNGIYVSMYFETLELATKFADFYLTKGTYEFVEKMVPAKKKEGKNEKQN